MNNTNHNYYNHKIYHHHHHHNEFFSILFLFFLILTHPVRGEQVADEQQQHPSPLDRAMGLTGMKIDSPWDTIRAWVKLAWLNLRPPDSQFGVGGNVMKEAATRSFEASQGTVEQTAASAANVAGDMVEKTKEKVKRTVSSGSRDSEL